MIPRSRSFPKAIRLITGIALMVGVLGISGCNTWLYKYYFGDDLATDTSIEKAPAQLAVEGSQKMQDKDYEEALKDFQQLKERYPYSKYAILAELKVGDAHFQMKNYAEAAVAYEEFSRLHPRNEVVPYVLYQLGMCHFLSFDSVDRDSEETHLAMEAFKRVMEAYPQSPYARKAEKQLFECKKRIAAYEFMIARFYYRRGEYSSAAQRLEKLLKDYPEAIEDLKYREDAEEMHGKSVRYVEERQGKKSIWSRLGF